MEAHFPQLWWSDKSQHFGGPCKVSSSLPKEPFPDLLCLPSFFFCPLSLSFPRSPPLSLCIPSPKPQSGGHVQPTTFFLWTLSDASGCSLTFICNKNLPLNRDTEKSCRQFIHRPASPRNWCCGSLGLEWCLACESSWAPLSKYLASSSSLDTKGEWMAVPGQPRLYLHLKEHCHSGYSFLN